VEDAVHDLADTLLDASRRHQDVTMVVIIMIYLFYLRTNMIMIFLAPLLRTILIASPQ